MLPKKSDFLIPFAATTVLLLLLSACSRVDGCFHRYLPVSGRAWCKADTLCFTDTLFFPTADVPDVLFLETSLRHNDCYPYENILFRVLLRWDSPTDSFPPVEVSQLHSISLVSPRHHWSGEGWGSLHCCNSQPQPIAISDKYRFYGRMLPRNIPDTLRVAIPLKLKVMSAMRDDRLPGIESVGIRLSRP